MRSNIHYRVGLTILLGLSNHVAFSQLLTWTPTFPGPEDPIKITVDATKGNKGLSGFSGNVYVHIGVITSASKNPTDWKYVPFTWGGTDGASQAISTGANTWQYSITNIRNFFKVPANEEILRIVLLFRQGGCSNCASQRNADGSDMYIKVSAASMQLRYEKPDFQPLFNPAPEPLTIHTNKAFDVNVITKEPATISLSLNSLLLWTASDTTILSKNLFINRSGSYTLSATAINTKGVMAQDSFSFFIREDSGPVATTPLPAGVRPGINRRPGDTSIILALTAPNKSKVAVLGDFPGNDWMDKPGFQMNLAPDQKTWWLQINGLQTNTEYSYQYLVDGSLKIADPYAEKILDPAQDGFISSTTYPMLKPYPLGKTSGIVSVVQPSASAYVWKNKFTRPDKSQLVIYELLLRDFLGTSNFNTLTDTLNYLSSLGINTIELMPIQEFDGNQSWGYNPAFYFAPDKYYGTALSLKRLIDSCHGRGIAVVLDMVLNHATGACPLAALYWDGVNQRPAADNPWFNVTARHPFSVFNDFNHESPETKYFSTRVMEYWLREYHVDGYRFDLSKGFTQKNNPNDVGAWSAYDASRIAIWKQYYDSIQWYEPGAYTILEHFADPAEEFALADAGMLLWGNANSSYNEATMGYISGSNLEGSLYQSRNWTKPHLITYMESHDEERLMFKNIQFGNSSGSYSTKNFNTALDRMKMAASFFFMSPGPKMIWQFGELGYDYSINTCTNGTVNANCRLDNKPSGWPYASVVARKSLLDWYKKLLAIRKTNTWQAASPRLNYGLAGAVKWLGYNANNDLNVVVVGNFDVKANTTSLGFPKTGIWFDLKDNSMLNVNQTIQNLTLQPGEYHVYMDKTFEQTTPHTDVHRNPDFEARLYPNPSMLVTGVEILLQKTSDVHMTIINLQGQIVRIDKMMHLPSGRHLLPITPLPKGSYFIKVYTPGGARILKYVAL